MFNLAKKLVDLLAHVAAFPVAVGAVTCLQAEFSCAAQHPAYLLQRAVRGLRDIDSFGNIEFTSFQLGNLGAHFF